MDVTDKQLSRRQFLKGAAALGLTASVPFIIPSRALGADGAVAPSNRIVIACIGVGGMGTSNLQSFLEISEAQVVAVCDVDRAHRERAQKIVDDFYSKAAGKAAKGCATYNDFREVLARPDIDAVMIATPDHWHAPIAIAAAKAGKDIYCEKPLALTIGLGRQMSDTMKRYGRVFQTGSWQRSIREFRFACELVRNGRIGRVKKATVTLPPGVSMEVQPVMPVPAGFDYDMWLGPAPWAPYTERRCHYNFRFNFDYSGGKVTDWGAHHHDIVQWALGTELSGPVEIEGKGLFPTSGLYNVPTDFNFTCTYADGVKLVTHNDTSAGILFEGTEGTLYISRERFETTPAGLVRSAIAPGEIHLYESSRGHHQNFLDCIRSRGVTAAPCEVAHRSITIAHLGNLAMRLGRKLRWDPAQEDFVNDPEASRMLTRGMRSPWQL